MSTAAKSMPFFERNSFVLRQLLQPGWTNRRNLSVAISIFMSSLRPAKLAESYQPQPNVSNSFHHEVIHELALAHRE
jgi:hypothetical protein